MADDRKNVFTDANTDPRTGKPKAIAGFTPQGQGAPFVQQAKANAAAPDMAASNAKEFQSAIDTEAKMNAPVAMPRQTQPSDFMGNTRIAMDEAGKSISNAYKVGGFPGAAGQAIRETVPAAAALYNDVAIKPFVPVANAVANTVNTAITGDAKPVIGAATPAGFQPQNKGTGYGFGDDASEESSMVKPAQAPRQTASKVAPPAGDKIYNKEAGIAEYVGAHGERAFSNIRPEDRNKGGNMTVVPANTYGMYDPTKPLPVAQPTQSAQGFAPGNQVNHVRSVGLGFEPKDPAIVRAETIQRNAEMAAGRAGIGQATPKMLEAETNKMQAYDAMATAGMNNATRQDEIAANAGARGAELAQRGSQFDATNRLAQNADNRAQGAYGFSLADSTRMQAAQDAVTNAKTPEERSLAAQNLRALQGKDENKDKYIAVDQGSTLDEKSGMVIKNPDRVISSQTGLPVEGYAQEKQAQQPPKQGDVSGGYRFKGGNPADQNNWEKI